MTDGIGVKAQKPAREKRAGQGPMRHDTERHDTERHDTERHDTERHDTERHDTERHDTERHDTERHDTERHDTEKARGEKARGEKARGEKRHDTDVLLLPRKGGGEQVVCEGVSGRWSLVEAARSFLRREWGGSALSVVALTDGAKTIRADLSALFGAGVRVVLDWYHLSKRVYQQLSMAAHSMPEREDWERQVLAWLWRGDVGRAEEFLAGVVPRNGKALADLLGYLDKHREEIIDYKRRREAGKPIGSGRMEKCVDQVVGHRQKGKGMSWTKDGSRALALLKMAELNARQPLPA